MIRKSRFKTCTVIVEFPQFGASDSFGDAETNWVSETVKGVLIAPDGAVGMAGKDDDYGSATRPQGVKATYVLYIPKTWNKPLRGARVTVPGESEPFGVVGDPKPYEPANTPGEFNYVVYLAKVKG